MCPVFPYQTDGHGGYAGLRIFYSSIASIICTALLINNTNKGRIKGDIRIFCKDPSHIEEWSKGQWKHAKEGVNACLETILPYRKLKVGNCYRNSETMYLGESTEVAMLH